MLSAVVKEMGTNIVNSAEVLVRILSLDSGRVMLLLGLLEILTEGALRAYLPLVPTHWRACCQ